MYLNTLTNVEKELFLELALNACYANGELDPNEKVMMDQYGSEMGIKINSYKPSKTQSQVLEDLKSIKAIETLRKIYIEITALMMVDGVIDKDEEKYLKEIQKIASLKDSQVVRIRTSLEQIFSGYEYLNSIIS
ncbi:MAG: hypothetical protein E6550_07915 [Veillonella sp.]|jgi:hypothetical protein|uniref:hypothetical protein n=1 Tax=Veillonella sp. TaxID=1926307 RepID=UPI0029104285|nr:hypothetical protein [Veillonella sp.]MDU6398583.1 hypothetical protein [Veillonella sp.]